MEYNNSMEDTHPMEDTQTINPSNIEEFNSVNEILKSIQDKLNNATAEELSELHNNLKTTYEKVNAMLEESTDKMDEIKYGMSESEGLKPLNELYLKMKSMNNMFNDCLCFLPYKLAREFALRNGLDKCSWNKYRKIYNKQNVIQLIYDKWCTFNTFIIAPRDEAYTIYTLCWALGDEQKGKTTYKKYHNYIKNKFNFRYRNGNEECKFDNVLEFD
jgi:hypothetical protein